MVLIELGFLKQRQKETDYEVRENMIEYAIELLQDTVDFSWQVAKGAHFVLVHRIGDGSASWKDLDSVNKMRSRYSHSGNQGVKISKMNKIFNKV